MFKWKKLGRVFIPGETMSATWITEFAQAPSALVFPDFVRVYISSRPPSVNGLYTSNSGYIDLDRGDLTRVIRVSDKPVLGLGGVGCFDEFGIYPISVLQTEDRFLAYYAGWTRALSVPFNTAIGAAVSNDGEHFTRMGPGPALSYSLEEPFVMSGPKLRKFNDQYHLFYIAGRAWILDEGRPEPVYKIRHAVSDDGLNWVKQNSDLVADKFGDAEAQASPDVFYLNGLYHMFFCYRQGRDYRNSERGYRIGYASSSDLINWSREDRTAGIDVSESGWDSEMVSYPHVLELDGSVYLMYLGNEVGRYGFGIARMEAVS